MPLIDVGRRGKYLLLRFEPVTFIVHLMQGGRLLVDAKQSAKPRNGQARFVFQGTPAGAAADRGRHRAARRRVVRAHAGRRRAPDGPPLDRLGPEALDVDAPRSWPPRSPRTTCASTGSCATST